MRVLVTLVSVSFLGAAAVKVMPLGDSITGSPGCWRGMASVSDTDHLGSFSVVLEPSCGRSSLLLITQRSTSLAPSRHRVWLLRRLFRNRPLLLLTGCGVPYDGDSEGHGGILATGIVSSNQLPGWLSTTKPDVVMMHLGTNDVWSNKPTADILSAFSVMVDQMRASNSKMKIIVNKIIPMNPSGCTYCGSGAVALNNAIPAWVASKNSSASPISVVDQWTGFSTATDTYDGVHPNDSGNVKIANVLYPALAPLV